MKQVHLVIPCGGAGSRFYKNGYSIPKPLINLFDKPFIYWAAKSVFNIFDVKDITFIVLSEHIKKFNIDKEIRKYFPNANISVLPYQLNGPVFTALSGVSYFADGDPIVFQDCDHAMTCNKFELKDDVDGAIMSFNSREPCFGYIKYVDDLYVGTVEKNPVSDYAIFGCYYFRNAETFVRCAVEYFNDGTSSEYFMSGLYNYISKVQRIDVKEHFEFGTPGELDALTQEVTKLEFERKLRLQTDS